MKEKNLGVFANISESIPDDFDFDTDMPDMTIDDIIESNIDSINIPATPELLSIYEDNLFFDPGERYHQLFYNYHAEFHSLYMYYIYSVGLFKALSQSYDKIDNYVSNHIEDIDAAQGDAISDAGTTYKEHLPTLSNQSILLMLYSSFEKFLGTLIDEESKDKGVAFINDLYSGSLVDKYLKYLNITIGMKCYIPQSLKNRFYAIRKVRNYYVHSNYSKEEYSKLVNELRVKAPNLVVDNNVPLDHKFVVAMFKSIAEMVIIIIKAYWDYHYPNDAE